MLSAEGLSLYCALLEDQTPPFISVPTLPRRVEKATT